MAASLKSMASFLQLRKPENDSLNGLSFKKSSVSVKRFAPVAALTAAPTPGLAETFSRLKKDGKVISSSFFFHHFYVMGLFSLFSVIWVFQRGDVVC